MQLNAIVSICHQQSFCYSLQSFLLTLAVHSVVERVIPWHGEAGAFWLAPKQSHNIHSKIEVQPLPSQSLTVSQCP